MRMRRENHLVGWRYGVFIGAFIGCLGLFIYPAIISPMFNPNYYREQQVENRKGIKQEDIQPGNMKVWSDPFGRK